MKNSVIKYNKEIYCEQILYKAIKDYSRISEITIIDNGDYWLCQFTKCLIDEERVKCEFDNYLIELLNTQGEYA